MLKIERKGRNLVYMYSWYRVEGIGVRYHREGMGGRTLSITLFYNLHEYYDTIYLKSIEFII